MTRAADSIAMPSWALNEGARALIDALIIERPDYRITRGTWIEGGGVKVYRGPIAGKLRQMHDRWLTGEHAALDARYHAAGIYDQAASDALHRTEDANTLIARVLRETEAVQIVDVERLASGEYVHRIAA